MEFQRVVDRRRMVRTFSEEPLPAATVDRILRNAARAPSAGFSQGWAFLALTERDDLERFWEAAWPPAERAASRRVGVMRAPLVIVPCADKQTYLDRYAEPDKGWTDKDESRWPVPYWLIDTAFASMLMLLTAVDEELGALFFGLEHEDPVREAFGIPQRFEPIGVIAIGYAERDEPSPSLRRGHRPQDEVVHYGRW